MTQRRNAPRLMGNMEARAVLGVSRSMVSLLVAGGRLKPVSRLACGDIFLAEEVDALRRERDLRKNKDHH